MTVLTRAGTATARQAAQSNQNSRLDIQGLRAVAVLLVVTYHAGFPVSAGFAGVDVFFVISGFVITGQIERMHEAGAFSYSQFYGRRLRRLFPALALLVVTVLLGSLLLQSPLGAQSVTAQTAAGAVLGMGNLVILRTSGDYFDAAATTNPLLHVWSLGVEEQFYLAFPLVLIFILRQRKRHRVVIPTLVGLTVLSFVVGACFTYAGSVAGRDMNSLAFYLSPMRAWEFGTGSLLALWTRRHSLDLNRRLTATSSTVTGLVGLALLLASNFVIDDRTPWPGYAAVLPVAATTLIIGSGCIGAGLATRALSTRPLVTIGDLSYSIYLWHWPMIAFGALLSPASWVPVAAALFSVLPAWLSSRYVEGPVRSWKLSNRRTWALAGAAGAATIALTASLPFFGSAFVPQAASYRSDRAVSTYGEQTGCFLSYVSFQPADLNRCTTHSTPSKGVVMLVGDSHADALSSGVAAASHRLGYDVLEMTGAGCDFRVDAPPTAHVSNCAQMNQAILARATGDNRPAVVIVGQWFAPRIALDATWPATIRPTLLALRAAGVPVLMALDVPNFSESETANNSACRGGMLFFACSKSKVSILAYQAGAREAELNLAQSIPGVRTFDPWPSFCNSDVCDPLVRGRLGYRDYSHLNGLGSQALAPRFEEALKVTLEDDALAAHPRRNRGEVRDTTAGSHQVIN